jgi:peptidoglycan/xylan/chitin deacetylase (PgdA/CDA1 family)
MRATIKRWARRTLIGATGMVASRRPHCRDRVITYHRIGEGGDASWVSPASFRSQMRFLARSCDVLAPSALAGAVSMDADAKTRVRITVDDGHASAMEIAAPILAELALDAAFFIPTDGIGRLGQLSKLDIRRLSDAGFLIGSHSCSHRSMTSLSPSECRREAAESRRILEDITGRTVETFAYPFGTAVDFGASTQQVLEEAGYRRAFTSQHGALSASTHPLRIPRLKIENGDSLDSFKKIVGGAADAWRWVDRYLWWLQRGGHRRPLAS